MGLWACQLFDGSTSCRVDAPTLERLNARIRVFLSDPTLDTSRLVHCAELAGWDDTNGHFSPECQERDLELMVHSLNDVQTILRLHTESEHGKRRRSSKDKSTYNSLLTKTLSKELLTKTLSKELLTKTRSKELVDGLLGRSKSRDLVSDQSVGLSSSSTNTSPVLVGITEMSPSQSTESEFSEPSWALPSNAAQSTRTSQHSVGTKGNSSTRSSSSASIAENIPGGLLTPSVGTRSTRSSSASIAESIPGGARSTRSSAASMDSIPPAEGRLTPSASALPVDEAEERLMEGLYHIVGNYEIDFNELEFEQGHMGSHNRMGIGGYGEVFLATWQGTEVAVKRLLDQDMGKLEVLEDFRAELDIQSRLRHANVVMWMGACTKPPNLAVVLEAIYTKTKHGPRGRSLHFILHKTTHNITWLQVRQSAGVSAAPPSGSGFKRAPRLRTFCSTRAARQCLAWRSFVGFAFCSDSCPASSTRFPISGLP